MDSSHGIIISVEPAYLAEHSEPHNNRYVFTYEVTIINDGDAPARLDTRHWVITHAGGHVEEVRGPGVVGEHPYLEPGDGYRYSSYCILSTPRGTMHGSYQMVRDDGERFDAEIPAFVLAVPGKAAADLLN